MTLEEFLKKSREIEGKATPGPWRTGRDDINSYDMDGVQFKKCYTEIEDTEIQVWTDFPNEDAKELVHARNVHKKLLEIIEIQAKALRLSDEHWFNRNLDRFACMECDCGEAGEITNADGHDKKCSVSAAHSAIAAVEKIVGEMG